MSAYGEIPSTAGIAAENLVARTRGDKKTVQGKIHFVLTERIGTVTVKSGIEEQDVLAVIEEALA